MKDASRTAPRKFTFGAATLALALLIPALPGCVSRIAQIEQGQAISTGKPPYDEFFEAVRALREASLEAEQQTVDARAELARALGLDARSNVEDTLTAAHARADKLRDSGVLLHVELTPEPKLMSTKSRRPLQSEDTRMIEAVATSVKASLDLSKQLGSLSKRAAELESTRSTLEAKSDAIFAENPKRREVAREIEAAGRVLTEAGELGDRYAGVASRFVLDLAHAVETGPGAAGRGPAGRPATSRPTAPSKRASPSPGSTARAPTAKPPSPPHGGDDFDP